MSLSLREWIDEQKKQPKAKSVEEEEKDNFKPVILPPEIIGKLAIKLDKYKPKLTAGQYQQCLSIWEYDPYAAIRYCKVIISYQRRNKNKDWCVNG